MVMFLQLLSLSFVIIYMQKVDAFRSLKHRGRYTISTSKNDLALNSVNPTSIDISHLLITLETAIATQATADASGTTALISGLVGGAASCATKETLLHPIDTIRARVQNGASYSDPLTYKALFNGVIPGLIGGIPAGAVFFGVKDYLEVEVLRLLPMQSNAKEIATIVAVILANIPYWLIRNPTEVLKTNEQVQVSSAAASPSAASTTTASSWLYAWYGSFGSNIIYALPADLIKFLAYEHVVSQWFHHEGKLVGWDATVAGALASMFAQFLTTPLDVARTRIMLRAAETGNESDSSDDEIDRNTNPWVEILHILQQKSTLANADQSTAGWRELMLGLTPRMLRAMCSGAIQFATYEYARHRFF